MGETVYSFPETQMEYLRAYAAGRTPTERSRRLPARISLIERMPPVYQQALQGTCVANAAIALLEYYGDCKTRLSVQYLWAATKEVERRGLVRNLAALREGGKLDAGFEAVLHAELMQLRMLADANGGMESPAVRPYLTQFEEGVKARFARSPGSLLVSCFNAIETNGVCRYALWPYAGMRTATVFGEVGATLEVPPGTDEDAAKHRVTSGLYLLGTPNNVDEIRGILAGSNRRRKMPVVVTVDFFEGCDGVEYKMPPATENATGGLGTVCAWQGRHALLIVGYDDNPKAPGGGWFLIRNSLGEGWGDKGYGKMPYAYLECFAIEAGTILQDLVDYLGDGYDGQHDTSVSADYRKLPIWKRLVLNALAAAVLVAGTLAVVSYERHREIVNPRLPPGEVKPEVSPPPKEASLAYKVFFSCESVEVRQGLRNAFASEDVAFPVEFMPQNLSSVLSMRVKLASGADVHAALAEVLQKHYQGPSAEFWRDMEVLLHTRRVYVVNDSLRRWNDDR